MRPSLLALPLLGLAACSSSAKSGPSAPPVVSSNQTWGDGEQLTESVTIAPGATVTIAPGATIHADYGVQITVKGTLTASGGAEANITSETSWSGILVDQGGTLTLKNVDLTNTSVGAIAVNAGAATATYNAGTITASAAPFAVQSGAKLGTDHATVKGALGASRIQGELDATYLDYDCNGNDGITAESDTAVVSVEDSELHGISGQDSDMMVSYLGAGTIHVAYTEIKNVHCAFHIERMTNLDVSYVNATGNSYGFMFYGSLNQGTKTVTSMNIDGQLAWGIDEEDGVVNGPISITNTYIANNATGNVYLQAGSNISITSPATAAIANAHPR